MNPQISGAESQCNLGISKKGSKPCEYIPELSEGELPVRSFMWVVLTTLRNEAWQELFKNARKSRSSGVEEDNNEMIEIHLTMLDKLMKIQNISKGSLKFEDWIIFIYRERTHSLSFEKKSFVLRNTRRSQKEYPADLELLKGNRREQEEENIETSSQVPKSIANDDMNIDTPSKTATRLRQITNRDAEIEYEDQERTLRTSILLHHQS